MDGPLVVAVVLAVAVYAAGALYVALDADGRSRAWWVKVCAPALALLGGPLAVGLWLAVRPPAPPGWPGVLSGRWAPATLAAGFVVLMTLGGWQPKTSPPGGRRCRRRKSPDGSRLSARAG